MAVGSLNQAAAQALFKEKYRDLVPALFEAGASTMQKIEKRDVEKTGPRGVIAAKKVKAGGQVRTADFNGGGLGRGTGPQYVNATKTTIPLLVALEKTRAAQWYTQSNDISITNAAKDLIKDGTIEFKAQCDRYLFRDGTGVMCVVATGGGTASITGTTPFGVQGLRKGHRYQVYDATLATNRGIVIVDDLDVQANTATLVNTGGVVLPAGFTNGDKLLPDGVSGASPTWFSGIRYQFSSSASGFWDTVNRATYPGFRAQSVTATGALVPAYFRRLTSNLEQARPGCFESGQWEYLWHPAQRAQYEDFGLQMTQYGNDTTKRGEVDLLFDVKKFRIDGMPQSVDVNQNPSIIDLTNWKNWYRAETTPYGMYTLNELDTFPTYGGDGGLATSELLYLCQVFQWVVDDPGAGGYIESLSVPTGYQGN